MRLNIRASPPLTHPTLLTFNHLTFNLQPPNLGQKATLREQPFPTPAHP
ncbi:hypothetical protein BJP36_41640 [Moorena producens JHB]|uniref:Uncharacterized protein n=1 Tax=Moorena producens (strain JHB) TaxID=1454205 RepID=A0A9Q9UVI8_MOOP1|nr:hypothetical protein [Moorena producens]WAN68868.1 hypothetical protein BJP36_41640 [Moorena producens JHB]